jgi:hypothetical protein
VPITAEGRRLRARVAARRRHHPDHPELEHDRRTLKAAALERRIREAIQARPSLTVDQRARLARLLLSDGDAA